MYQSQCVFDCLGFDVSVSVGIVACINTWKRQYLERPADMDIYMFQRTCCLLYRTTKVYFFFSRQTFLDVLDATAWKKV